MEQSLDEGHGRRGAPACGDPSGTTIAARRACNDHHREAGMANAKLGGRCGASPAAMAPRSQGVVRGPALDPRTTSSPSSTTRRAGRAGSCMRCSSSSAAVRPMS